MARRQSQQVRRRRVIRGSFAKPFRPNPLEALEDRTLLDAGLPQDIIVGRVLSSYYAADVQTTHQITVVYTAYNEQADPETGVLLTTTLAPGVTIAAASMLPDQNGESLAWSLGSIQGFDRASVSVTLNLPEQTLLQLDAGAHVFATLHAGMVADDAPAARLRPGSVPTDANGHSLLAPPLDSTDPLAGSIDANDPFIQEAAAKLDYDPQQIYDFLHNEVGYNSYTGSLRGARGTLWSMAGNALDVSNLGIALMRASGIPALYVQGTLSQAEAQILILSMFPASYQTVGYIPADTAVSDPANDPQLLSETEQHYWFQFDSGSGLTDADPLIPGATIGQTFTTAVGVFTDIPDNLREKTEITLNAEIYSQIGGILAPLLGESPLTTTTVLNVTFNDVELVGRPLSIGNFVSTSSFGALFLTKVANTYSPYIDVGNEAYPDGSHDEVLRGDEANGHDYQEVLTNFPLANQVLTGLFLNVTLSSPKGPSAIYERTLVDRIGYTVRQNGGTPSLSIDPTGPPAITADDIYTVNVLPGMQDPRSLTLLRARTTALADTIAQTGSIADLSGSVSAEMSQQYLIEVARYEIASYLVVADTEASNLANAFSVATYLGRPRITVFGSQADISQQTLAFSIDLRTEDMRVQPYPGQNVQAGEDFNFTRGLLDSAFEQAVTPTAPGSTSLSSFAVLQKALAQGVPLAVLGSGSIPNVSTLNLPPDAKARVVSALEQGMVVLTPTAAVDLDGGQGVGWYEFDPTTGDFIGVLENGGHQSIGEYAAALGNSIRQGILVVGSSAIITLTNPVARLEKLAAFQVLHNLIDGASVATPFPPSEITIPAYLVLAIALALGDPPVSNFVLDLELPFPDVAHSSSSSTGQISPNLSAGPVSGSDRVGKVSLSNQMTAAWQATSAAAFQAHSIEVPIGTITDSGGKVVGFGGIGVSTDSGISVSASGNDRYTITGIGSLSFYGPAESSLGVTGDWQSYTATVAGTVSITLTVSLGTLTLNGQPLPAGTYTITTSSATLGGSGATSSPSFSGSVAITVANGTIQVGPGSGNLSVDGKPLDPTNEATLDGYSGTITVSANGDGTDSVSLNGNTSNLLQVTTTPSTLTTDQNTPVTFATNVQTSLADTYTLTANAPAGWTVSIDSKGNITATPAPELQGGAYPIQIIAQSQTDANMIAQTIVEVTITPTRPGISFAVAPDPQFSVPFNGAQLPTAFRASIQNLGPQSDTYNLTFSNVPSGFTLLSSGTAVTVPAGKTGILGVYLQPNAGQIIPPPGTQLSFDVTATSTHDPSITRAVTETFTVPAIDAVTITANPTAISTAPGVPITETITLTNAGNVPEDVTLADTLLASLSVSGLKPVSLAVGQSATETVTLTPGSSTPLGSTLDATITASYGPSGSPITQSVQIPVSVAVPGATAIANASVAAGQIGNTGLADRLSDLSTALTNLVQNPTSAVYKSQASASLEAVIALLSTDPYLGAFQPTLTADGAALQQAITASVIQSALAQLGTDLGTVGTTLTDEAAHRFTLSLLNNSAIGQPQVPTTYGIDLTNTGSQTTTYDLSLPMLPPGVAGALNESSITLAPGQSTLLTATVSDLAATLTSTSTTEIPSFSFSIRADAEGATEISRTVTGAFSARADFIDVLSVDTNPSFTSPGGQVDVTARILNAVNRQAQAVVSYKVTDATGAVVFKSQPQAITLNVLSTLSTVDLGNLNTTGFAQGEATITVTVTDSAGNPIPGATGTGELLIGLPVSASLTTQPTALPAGNGSTTTTLAIQGPVLSATVTVPTNNGVTIVPGSFNIAPTTITPGTDSAQLSWDFTAAFTTLYVTSQSPDAIEKVDPSTNAVTTILNTPGEPDSLVFDNNGDIIYTLADTGQVDLFNPDSGVNTIIASGLNGPRDLVLEPGGNSVLISDFGNNRIVRVDLNSDAVTTLADNTSQPQGIAYDASGNLFVVSAGTDSLLQLDPTTGSVLKTIPLQFGGIPDGVTFDPVTQAFWISNSSALIEVSHYLSTPLVQEFSSPIGGAFDGIESDGHGALYVADYSKRIVKYDIAANTFTALTSAFIDDLAPVTGIGSSAGSSTTITWQSSVSDLQPGEVRPVAEGASIQYAIPSSNAMAVDLGPYVNSNIQTYTNGGLYPVGGTELSVGGVPFTLADYPGGGTGVVQTASASQSSPSSFDIQTSIAHPQTVYTLINSGFGEAGYLDGAVEFFGTNGAYAEFDLVQGTNIRDHNNDGYNNTIASGTPSALFGGGQVRLDRQTFVLPSSFADATLTDIRFNGYGGFPTGTPFLAAVSVATALGQGATPGTLNLSQVAVTGKQIIGLNPATQTVAPAAPASYKVTLLNPTANPVTYALSVQGVPASWVNLPSSITVAANGSMNVPLVLTSDSFAALSDYGFTVTAGGDNGATGSVQGDVVLQGQPVLPDSESHGIVATLSPVQATAGQGTSAKYVVQLSNTGSGDDSFSLSVSDLPQGIKATFAESTIDVPPGSSNFRDVTLTLTPNSGTTPSDVPFTVTATSTSTPSVTGSASGQLTVVGSGVQLSLSPPTGAPGSTFQMTVKNTGNATDTFKLSLGGPAALVATLGQAQVTLAPGASQMIPVTTADVRFAVPGNLPLTAIAASEANSAVEASATANLTVGPTLGLTAQLNPATQVLPIPGTTSFLLLVNNTGNIQDQYTAEITGTTGPVTASLVGLDGNPTQSIPVFILPGLSTGAILIQTDIMGQTQGTVSVRVTSLDHQGMSASETATVAVAAPSTTRTQLVPASTVATFGQKVTLTAIVTPLSGTGTPAGFVTFSIDGVPQPRVALQTIDGKAEATFSSSTLAVGSHAVTAAYDGNADFKASTATAAVQVTATSGDGPEVTDIKRYGYHMQPTVLVLTFSAALDPNRAQDVANYQIVALNGQARHGARVGRVIDVRIAAYDPSAGTVTLYPTHRLNVHRVYQLTVRGMAPNGLTDPDGRFLDGQGNGFPGSNFVSLISRRTLVGLSANPRQVRRPSPARGRVVGSEQRNTLPVVAHPSTHVVDALAVAGQPTASVKSRHRPRIDWPLALGRSVPERQHAPPLRIESQFQADA